MINHRRNFILWPAAFVAASVWLAPRPASSRSEKRDRARVVLSHSIPSMAGDRLKATLVEVNYGPGEASPAHTHPCAVLGYVAEGELRTQVTGEPEHIYKAGESFYEAPNGVHLVSANASSTQPARLLAYMFCDSDAPLSTDVSVSAGEKARR